MIETIIIVAYPEFPKENMDNKLLVYINEKVWLSNAAWDYHVKYLVNLFRNKQTIILQRKSEYG